MSVMKLTLLILALGGEHATPEYFADWGFALSHKQLRPC